MAELVLDRRVDPTASRPGILRGYERLVVAEESYPALAPRAGGRVTGVVVAGISAAELARMQFFESEEFAPVACHVELTGGRVVSAHTFLACEVLEYTDRPWDYAHWLRHEKQDYLTLVRDWMREYGRRETDQLESEWSDARRAQVARHEARGGHEQQTRRGKP